MSIATDGENNKNPPGEKVWTERKSSEHMVSHEKKKADREKRPSDWEPRDIKRVIKPLLGGEQRLVFLRSRGKEGPGTRT